MEMGVLPVGQDADDFCGSEAYFGHECSAISLMRFFKPVCESKICSNNVWQLTLTSRRIGDGKFD